MDEPQEEFVAYQSIPSTRANPDAKDHRAEVQQSKLREKTGKVPIRRKASRAGGGAAER